MIQFRVLTPALKAVEADFRNTQRNVKKAPEAAARAVGFKFRRVMRSEVRRGKPGGVKWPKMSMVAKRFRKHRNIPGIQAMAPHSKRIAYAPLPGRNAGLEIGWLDWGTHATPSGILAHLNAQQEGYTTPVGVAQRSFFREWGRPRGGKKKSFVLKKSTKTLTTPARPLIPPFMRAHERQMRRDFEHVYREKIHGRFARI